MQKTRSFQQDTELGVATKKNDGEIIPHNEDYYNFSPV